MGYQSSLKLVKMSVSQKTFLCETHFISVVSVRDMGVRDENMLNGWQSVLGSNGSRNKVRNRAKQNHSASCLPSSRGGPRPCSSI